MVWFDFDDTFSLLHGTNDSKANFLSKVDHLLIEGNKNNVVLTSSQKNPITSSFDSILEHLHMTPAADLTLSWQCKSLPLLFKQIKNESINEESCEKYSFTPITALEFYYALKEPIINFVSQDPYFCRLYLSIVDIIYSYKGSLEKSSILWPHHLVRHICQALVDKNLNEQCFAMMWTKLEKEILVKKLVLNKPNLLPKASEAWVILFQAIKRKRRLMSIVFQFPPNEHLTLALFKMDSHLRTRVITEFVNVHGDSFFRPLLKMIKSMWSDQRVLLGSTIQHNEVITGILATCLSFLNPEEAFLHDHGEVITGVTNRMNSLEPRLRLQGMLIGELFSTTVRPIIQKVKGAEGAHERFKALNFNLDKELMLKDRSTQDALVNSIKSSYWITDKILWPIRCELDDRNEHCNHEMLIISDSEESEWEHQDLVQRRRYIEAGERVPSVVKDNLRAPRSISETLDWIRAGDHRVKFTLAIHHLLPLLKEASGLSIMDQGLRIFDTILATPNTFSVPEYDTFFQASLEYLLFEPWTTQTAMHKRLIGRICNHAYRIYYGDVRDSKWIIEEEQEQHKKKQFRALTLNVTQRLAIFTRLVGALQAERRGQLLMKTSKYVERVAHKNELITKFPALQLLEGIHSITKKETESNKEQHVSREDTHMWFREALMENFLIPFYRQAGIEYGTFFSGQNHALAAERALLFASVAMYECSWLSGYERALQSIISFATCFVQGQRLLNANNIAISSLLMPLDRKVELALLHCLCTIYRTWSPHLLFAIDECVIDMHKEWLFSLEPRYSLEEGAKRDMDPSIQEPLFLLYKTMEAIHQRTTPEAMMEREYNMDNDYGSGNSGSDNIRQLIIEEGQKSVEISGLINPMKDLTLTRVVKTTTTPSTRSKEN